MTAFRSYSIVAAYLYRTYPKLRVSYLSSIRQRLVQNSTLAKFATLYNMQEALELGPGYEKLRDDEKSASAADRLNDILIAHYDRQRERMHLRLSLAQSRKSMARKC